MEKSLIDYAFDFVSSSENPVSFKDMWEYVCAQANLSEEEKASRIARFYTNLMLDGRLVTLGENEWDLRSRHTFDKVHIDMGEVYSDVETTDDDSEDNAEEKEYNEQFEESKDDDSDVDDLEDSSEESNQ